jgi:predicted nucleic acid-binding protein
MTLVAEAYVVDTGVFLRWFLDQPGFEHAREVQQRRLAGGVRLVTTEMARIELAQVLRVKALLPGLVTRDEYLQALRSVDALTSEVVPADGARLVRAAALAADHVISVFDALFVEVALSTGLALLTADARLVRAVGGLVSTELLRGAVEAT